MKKCLYLLFALLFTLTSCSDSDDAYLLQRSDIVIVSEKGYLTEVGEVFRLQVNSVTDEGITYRWMMGKQVISESKNLEHVFESRGQYILKLVVAQGDIKYEYSVNVEVISKVAPDGHQSPYIDKVLDYSPAPGQFVNEMPKYAEGDTREDMNQKAFDAIGKNNLGLITLGGFGGYVVLGFDHTIQNVVGKQDFRILGNAFDGSSEPGIVMVSVDANKNGLADDEWYEIAGSAHLDPTQEYWYDKALAAGNDLNLYRNYQITYYRPETESEKENASYIRWEDNQGKSGYRAKNSYHSQPYYPMWLKDEALTFQGTCLPQNFIDESGEGTHFKGFKFGFGYADNDLNETIGATFDISWAVNSEGQKVSLKGIDFIKIYTGVNQENGWVGECSTEIAGAEDLHILGESIDTPTF